MGIGWLFLTIGVLWALQLLLSYQQARAFMARARALRRQGRVSIGASPRRIRGRAFVVVAVGSDDRITAAEVLRGITVFANAKPEPALIGRKAADLAAGAEVPGLAPTVQTAAQQAAAFVHRGRAPSGSGRLTSGKELKALADLSLFSALPVAGINETLGQWAEDFIGVFQKGAETFVGLVTGIIPLLIILLTAVHALIKMIGPERIDHIGEMAGRPGLRYYPIRYLVLPVLAVFFLTNPMCYTMGRFLPERDKPAFYDSAVSFVHPPLGLFPHVNAGELFVYAGIAAGITKLGLPLGDLAVRYFYVGLIVIFMRGIVTETISRVMFARRRAEDEPEVTATAPEGA